MKKIILLITIAVVSFACKSNSATSTKIDDKSQAAMKGTWIITAVDYPGSDIIKVTSFGVADSRCFVGSTWRLVSMSNKGDMALTKAGCPAFSSAITWFINKDGNFVLKVLEGAKSRKMKEGFVLKVANQSDKSFQLIDKIDVAGTITDVVYQFQKTSN